VFCIQVWWVTLFALDALAVAAQSLVASSLGTGDVPRARGAADRCLKWALAAGTAVGVGKFLSIRVWAIGMMACF
jgi:Na+-driven multidrug efflux pump